MWPYLKADATRAPQPLPEPREKRTAHAACDLRDRKAICPGQTQHTPAAPAKHTLTAELHTPRPAQKPVSALDVTQRGGYDRPQVQQCPQGAV